MKLSFKKISFRAVPQRIFVFWIRHHKAAFLFIFVALTGYSAFQWYTALYRYHWSETERQAYLDATVKETSLQEQKFLEVLSRLEKNQERHAEDSIIDRDLFAGAREEKR